MSEIVPSRVFVDANVLYSRTLTDWLCLLFLESSPPLYYVYWSEDILAETLYHLRKHHPEWSGGKISTIRDRMVRIFSLDLRVDDFEIDTAGFRGRDLHDAHVHSAAVACKANYLLTMNISDFKAACPSPPYEAVSPDAFFCLVDQAAPDVVRAVVERQLSYWGQKRSEAKLAEYLLSADCPEFAGRVGHHLAALKRPFGPPSPDRAT